MRHTATATGVTTPMTDHTRSTIERRLVAWVCRQRGVEEVVPQEYADRARFEALMKFAREAMADERRA